MTTYSEVFGNDAIPPSESSYTSVSLTANTQFYWPEISVGDYVLADTVDVASSAAYSITMPEANAVSTGRSIVFNNTSAYTLTIKDFGGNSIGTISAGNLKCLYLTDNSTANGTWQLVAFGSGTTTVDAAAIVGYGLKVTGTTLSQDALTQTTAATYSVVAADRAKTLIFSGSGAVTCNLLASLTATNGFFVSISNQGTGSVTIDPNSTETIDGLSDKELSPGESAFVVCDGTNWVTIGYGRSTEFQFTKLVLDISSGTPFTLSSTQAQNKLVQFIGIATTNIEVRVPAVVAVYYLECSYSGAFSLTIKTASGGGVTLANSDRAIVYCDGTDVVLAQTSAVPATTLSGGVAGAVVYQSATNVTSFTAAGTSGEILESAGTGVPVWRNIGVAVSNLTGKTTPVDADSVLLSDSAASNVGKKLTWANLKATLKTYFDTLYAALGGSVSQSFAAASIELGHASDTTLTRVSAGVIAVEGSNVLLASGLGSITQAYDADIPTVAASQGEMEAGTEANLRSMSPLRVAQAIAALSGGGGGASSNFYVNQFQPVTY